MIRRHYELQFHRYYEWEITGTYITVNQAKTALRFIPPTLRRDYRIVEVKISAKPIKVKL